MNFDTLFQHKTAWKSLSKSLVFDPNDWTKNTLNVWLNVSTHDIILYFFCLDRFLVKTYGSK